MYTVYTLLGICGERNHFLAKVSLGDDLPFFAERSSNLWIILEIGKIPGQPSKCDLGISITPPLIQFNGDF